MVNSELTDKTAVNYSNKILGVESKVTDASESDICWHILTKNTSVVQQTPIQNSKNDSNWPDTFVW